MKAIIPNFNYNSKRPLYLELYDEIKRLILSKEIAPNEKLPSLRALAKSLKISLTTVELAYNQLMVEGYINSKPQSGYYANKISAGMGTLPATAIEINDNRLSTLHDNSNIYHDLSCFDFSKWKKCCNSILTEHSHLLLHESDPQGEPALRYEISKYVYQSRGVLCTPDQIVIGAGTQQITSQLSLLLSTIDIKHVAVEEPGYLPVINIFGDRAFAISHIPVEVDGIRISKLPVNVKAAVYVNPSSQFPTGYVMPVGRRYELLHWAKENDSLIIEDDYDSELRYFGKPIPSLQGLDTEQKVVYLGSFSSTLFPSIKISYMILPHFMVDVFNHTSIGYSQTCSKMEQLTLALYMEKGLYQINIKKLRNLYSQKLALITTVIQKYGTDFITPGENSSGINMLINIKTNKSSEKLCQEAKELGIITLPISTFTKEHTEEVHLKTLVFYYNQIPLKSMEVAIVNLVDKWKQSTDQA